MDVVTEDFCDREGCWDQRDGGKFHSISSRRSSNMVYVCRFSTQACFVKSFLLKVYINGPYFIQCIMHDSMTP